jgi:GTPase SAR1 family protein
MVSKKAQVVIEHIVNRFLDPKMDYKADDFNSISDILDLPIYSLKNIDKELASRYTSVFKIEKIREFASLNHEHPLNILIPPQRDADINKHMDRVEQILNDARSRIGDIEKLKSTILIARMISNAWNKRTDYISKKDTKVITIGLDNAGKTAILSSLGGKLGIDTLAKLQPTKKIERKKVDTNGLELYIWDFGGQADYRKAYLESPEKFFLRTDLLIYVIDMQDENRYKESFAYFNEILAIMDRLGETPYILCFLHKADPDLIEDPDFQISIEFVKEEMKKILTPFQFEYDMYVTSIYNFFSSEPKFSHFIKDVLRDHQSLSDPMLEKVTGISKILETTLNTVLSLANSVGNQISVIEERLNRIEQQIASSSQQTQVVQQRPALSIPPPLSAEVQKLENLAIESKRQVESNKAATVSTSPPVDEKVNQTRYAILKDLQALMKKAKTIKD